MLVFNILCWGFCIVKIPFAFLSYDTKKIFAFCTPANTFSEKYVTYGNVEGNALMALIVATYTLAAVIMLYRYKKASFLGETQRQDWRRQVDFNVFVAMISVGLAYIASYGSTTLINSTPALTLSQEVAMKLGPVTTLLLLASSLSHLFIYLKFNNSFREAFIKMYYCKRNNAVVSLR